MALIKSISGIRGTIGGGGDNNLTPPNLVAFVSAYAEQIKEKFPEIKQPNIVLGRDGRISGAVVYELVSSTLRLSGLNVLSLDLATTPTVEMTVIREKAQGGIILSASHNPRQWNALKLLNEQGEFLSAKDGQEILAKAQSALFNYVEVDSIGEQKTIKDALESHIQAILALKLVKAPEIARANFKVVVDGINSVGALAIPELLKALGLKNIEVINAEVNGEFAHNPEPLDKNLSVIKEQVMKSQADLGIVVDPDVDRLAFINENGEMFGEEYTLVAVADYVMHNFCFGCYQKISVSNLSSSRALKDITEKRGGAYYATAVGEVNVVAKMKETGAIIGGEGNGGIIFPELHYGRDALVGTALFLSALVEKQMKMSEYRRQLPEYKMVKDCIDLEVGTDVPAILEEVKTHFAGENISGIDGIKIDWLDSWVHLRASNTEPIIRIYAEAKMLEQAELKVKEVKDVILANFK